MERITSPGSNQKIPLRAKSSHHFNPSKQSLYNGLPIADNSSSLVPKHNHELLNQASKTSNTFESRERLAKSHEKLV
jgi:hypothetical protein